MIINATLIIQVLVVLTILVVSLTLKFAKGKTENLTMVFVISFLLNSIFPPAGWGYCWSWYQKTRHSEAI